MFQEPREGLSARVWQRKERVVQGELGKGRGQTVGLGWSSEELGFYSKHQNKRAQKDFSREATMTPSLCLKMSFLENGLKASMEFLSPN